MPLRRKTTKEDSVTVAAQPTEIESQLAALDSFTLALDALDEQVPHFFDGGEARAVRVELAQVVREIRKQKERLREERGEKTLNVRSFEDHATKERARADWGAEFARIEAELDEQFEGVVL
jgi:hypothetical protein